MSEHALSILYIPCPTQDEAEELSKALLKKRLIACTNIIAATSLYAWLNALNKADEWIVVAKTIPPKVEKAKELILSIHSYELPCILEFTVSTTKAYHAWVVEQVS